MDSSKNHQNTPDTDERHGSVPDSGEILSFDYKDYPNSRKFLIDLMKDSLLLGADRVLMDRRWPATAASLNGLNYPSEEAAERNSETCKVSERKIKSLCSVQENEKVFGKYSLLQSSSNQYEDDNERVFPLNLLAFSAILVLKFIGFQINLVTSFLSLPIWFSYSAFMFVMFPFQTLTSIREHLTKRMLRMPVDLYLTITAFIFTRFKSKKPVLNLAIRFGRAAFWSVYVGLVLLGLLVSGFVLGGLATRRLVERPVHSAETLDFDYTKASPVAFVPVVSAAGAGVFSGLVSKDSAETGGNAGLRAIPCNHKLQLTVSLTLPESEYNRELGVFQVRVEFLSANGKVTASSSHPSMLRFKSQPIRIIETIFKSAPFIAGLQSEAQTLNVKVRDFTEGYEPTVGLKVVLEPRAEHQLRGAGIPQIYTASIALESELPRLKKMVWFWRRTIFVWISVVLFLTELGIALIFFRPVIMPRGRPKAVGARNDSPRNKIS